MKFLLPMSRRSATLAAMLLVSALAPATVRASDQGWFGGISAAPFLTRGEANINLTGDDLYPRPRSAYTVSRSLGIEVGYADGGRPGSDLLGGSTGPSGLARGWLLSGTGTLSVSDRLGLVGRLGAYRGDIDLNPINRALGDPGVPHPTYGMGVKYDFTSNLRVQGGWDRYQLGNGPRVGTDPGVDLVSIGLKYRF